MSITKPKLDDAQMSLFTTDFSDVVKDSELADWAIFQYFKHRPTSELMKAFINHKFELLEPPLNWFGSSFFKFI